MNLRITTHLSYEGDIKGIQEIVADFAEALVARGYGNKLDETHNIVSSLIVVKENKELSDGTCTLDEFWAGETADQVLSVLPMGETEDEGPEDVSMYIEEKEEASA